MPVISFMNQKGGVGKTTLAVHVAYMLKMSGHEVILADCDPQQSLIKWDGLRGKLTDLDCRVSVVNLAAGDIMSSLRDLSAKYEYVIVDGAPRLTELGRSILAASDIVLMPVKPSGPDILATKDTVDMIKDIAQLKPIKAAFIMNAKKGQNTLSGQIQKELEKFNYELCDITVGDRVVYQEGLTYGYTAMEIDTNPRSKHHIEMTRIVDYILRLEGKGKVVPFKKQEAQSKPQRKVKA